MFLIIVQIISVSETRSREHTRISIKLITIFYLVYVYIVITMISNLINYTNIIIATNHYNIPLCVVEGNYLNHLVSIHKTCMQQVNVCKYVCMYVLTL